MKYIILGAGPAGLTFANMLLQNNHDDFLILESNDEAGGLCRSVDVDKSPMDIGGGHFLDTRREDVLKFLFKFMPRDEWNMFERDSQINIHNQYIHHPIETNLWELPEEYQVEYLKSIASAGCNIGESIPERFKNWVHWKLGYMIAENYMLPYNEKMFGNEFDNLGTYWLEKLPNVSFEETLLSCLNKKPYGSQPGHSKFLYPKDHGYGELWLRMARRLGDKIKYNTNVSGIDFNNRAVSTASGELFKADRIITTIPWKKLTNSIGLYDNAKEDIAKLKNNSIQTDYYDKTIDNSAHWIYYPCKTKAHHRILVRHNFLLGSNGYWTETTGERTHISKKESKFSFFNDYAYPLNTIEKPNTIGRLLSWAETKSVYGLGRWGEHEHYNSDVTVQKSMHLALRLLNRK